MEAIVIRSTGSWYSVKTADGQICDCRLKGQFRIHGMKATNPIAVGDTVVVSFTADGEPGVIVSIKERKNYIVRKATKLSKKLHIIAANIDMAYVVATLKQPRTSTGFIDRFLVTAAAYHIPAGIVFNKSDIYGEPDHRQLDYLTGVYSDAGYPCSLVSALDGSGIEPLREDMKGRINLFSGHSGVGKSALINALEPGAGLKTGSLSEYYLKGKHTTTFAEMHPMQNGGYIIDTPGLKEFGLIDFKREDLTHFFPEMFRLLSQCRFYNCTHVSEPGCAVKDAVEKGIVSEFRYQNYLNIFHGEEMDEGEWDS